MMSGLGKFLIQESDNHAGIKMNVIQDAANKFLDRKDGDIIWRLGKVVEYANKIGLYVYPVWID